ncbi:hypothetical protein ACQ4PT_042355 [Festuca glaucescens]
MAPAAAAVADDEDDYEDYIPVSKRRATDALRFRLSKPAAPASLPPPPPPSTGDKTSLIVTHAQSKKSAPELTATERLILQEKEMLQDLSSGGKPLVPVGQAARGITYTEPLRTGWKPPLRLRRMPRAEADELRRKWHILVEGDEVPPPARDFRDLRLPEPVLRVLREKGVVRPTPIQVQGLPVALSGRDMIGIAFTGSGKTLVFVLPLVMLALQEETLMPIVPGEGPFGMIICPSRELAKQTYDVIEMFLAPLKQAGFPEIRPLLCIGGIDMRTQLDVLKKGVHIVVATPGRLKDLLAKKKMNLENCSVDGLRTSWGVEAAAIHGGKDQEERQNAIEFFKSGKKDVLVATDVASKGLDFPDIQHVINYNKPAEIENYVHRIGRTGRCGKTGVATTFINRNQTETTLLDLKHLLKEAKQRIPPVLAELVDPLVDAEAIAKESGVKGCQTCGGLGHRIADCPKRKRQNSMAIAASIRDQYGGAGYRGEI